MNTKIYIIFSLIVNIFVTLGYAVTYANPNNFQEQLDNAWKLYDSEDYSASFPIFDNLCIKQNYIPACYALGVSYRYGRGVNKDSKMALDLFGFMEYVYSDHNPHNKELATNLMASVYEDVSEFQKAKQIYESLLNSKYDDIRAAAKKGLQRENIYNFLLNLFRIIPAYDNSKINAEQLGNMFHSLNLNDIPKNALKYFINYKDGVLKYKKFEDSRDKKALGMLGKAFTSDLSVLLDAYNSIKDIKSRKRNMNETMQNFIDFINELIKDGVSKVWILEKLKNV